MSPNCSRKSFFAKLLGLVAGVGLVPKIFARQLKPDGAVAAPVSKLSVRADQRAVVRRDGTF